VRSEKRKNPPVPPLIKGENKIPPIPPLIKGGIKWGDLERKDVKI